MFRLFISLTFVVVFIASFVVLSTVLEVNVLEHFCVSVTKNTVNTREQYDKPVSSMPSVDFDDGDFCEIGFLVLGDQQYEKMLIEYSSFVLCSVPHSRVEIVVRDLNRFLHGENSVKMELARESFGPRLKVRELHGSLSNLPMNGNRFLETPTIKCDMFYIGDVDIFIVEAKIAQVHRCIMENTNLPYSNLKRPHKNRLTGLHAVDTLSYYGDPRMQKAMVESRKIRRLGDEARLFNIVAEAFGKRITDNKIRPYHGFHFSFNRGVGKRMMQVFWPGQAVALLSKFLQCPILESMTKVSDTLEMIKNEALRVRSVIDQGRSVEEVQKSLKSIGYTLIDALSPVPNPDFPQCHHSHDLNMPGFRANRYSLVNSKTHPPFAMHLFRKDDIVSHHIQNGGLWDTATSAVLLAGLKTLSRERKAHQNAFLDVGANLGWFSLLAASKGYHVIAIEASNENFVALAASRMKNAFSPLNLKLLNMAVSSRAGEELCIAPRASRNKGNQQMKRNAACREENRLITGTLDSVLFLNPRNISVVKLDCGGCEVLALLGMKSMLSSEELRPCLIVLEWRLRSLKEVGGGKAQAGELKMLLQAQGYDLYVQKDDDPIMAKKVELEKSSLDVFDGEGANVVLIQRSPKCFPPESEKLRKFFKEIDRTLFSI